MVESRWTVGGMILMGTTEVMEGEGGTVPLSLGQPTQIGLRRDLGTLQWKAVEQLRDSRYRNTWWLQIFLAL